MSGSRNAPSRSSGRQVHSTLSSSVRSRTYFDVTDLGRIMTCVLESTVARRPYRRCPLAWRNELSAYR